MVAEINFQFVKCALNFLRRTRQPGLFLFRGYFGFDRMCRDGM